MPAKWNPFARRELHSTGSIRSHRAASILTWILSLVVSVYYTVHSPDHGRKIWAQNYATRSAFTMNSVIAEIYWIILFILQIAFVSRLFSSSPETASSAANLAGHFALNNILHFAFILLFVRGLFAWAELLLLLNLLNLTSSYLRHGKAGGGLERVGHVAAVSGPLAWTYVAVFWNGALMVRHPADLVPRIFGNVFIWSILGFGLFFLVGFKDYTMGLSLSVLMAAIGVAQFRRQVIALQWIFAFIIMGLLFVVTVGVGAAARGRAVPWRRRRVSGDAEHAPLLGEA